MSVHGREKCARAKWRGWRNVLEIESRVVEESVG